MPRVVFTANLQRHVACPEMDVPGRTVREILDAVHASNPQVLGYVLDEHGALRKHMVIFVNGEPVTDRERLTDAVEPGAEVCIMQALSGG